MKISCEWHGNQFNVNLAAKEGADTFLQIKGCRIVESKNGGKFVSYPARKNEETGKWWNHVWGSEKFNEAVMKAAEEAQPHQGRERNPMSDMKDDVPF